jgi:nucleoid DNA-binding protein
LATRVAKKKKSQSRNSRKEFWSSTELVDALAQETGFPKTDTKIFLTSLGDVIADALASGRGVKIDGIVQMKPAIRAAQKARVGRNPRTGEQVDIPRKPASVVLRARFLKKGKEALPTVQKVRRIQNG